MTNDMVLYETHETSC